ncbi:hypothetical protein HDV05_000770 [Chytridiales sp. JEL 0842]|nr:hypothetical protein HDV05_000770 [Chytridiales sp. JEL 0842]
MKLGNTAHYSSFAFFLVCAFASVAIALPTNSAEILVPKIQNIARIIENNQIASEKVHELEKRKAYTVLLTRQRREYSGELGGGLFGSKFARAVEYPCY